MHTPRSFRIAAAATACVAVLAGCGSGSGTGDESVTTDAMTPAAAMQRVASSVKTVASSSYTFEMAGAGVAMKGHGAYSTKPDLAMQMVFDSMSMGGMNMGSLGGGMEQRIIGDTLYMRGGALSMLGAGGGKWMKISFGKVGDVSGIDIKSMMTQATQADPRQQIQALLAAGNVESVGKETVDGVSTTHYTGDLDVAALAGAAQLDDATKDELKKSYDAAGMKDTHLDVWVDDDFQARRFMSTSETPMGDVKMTMNFTDYGKTVDIAAPAPEDVVDMSSLAKMGSKMGSNVDSDLLDGTMTGNAKAPGLSS